MEDGVYLITGGSGYLGHALIRRLIGQGKEKIRVIGRDEGSLVALKEKFPIVEIIPGDIADHSTIEKAIMGVSGVFHLAAFKHVTMAEENVRQCVLSNVIGTMSLLDELPFNDVEFFSFISTDKASTRKGVYGSTKFLCERLIQERAQIMPQIKFRIVRYGNVWGSTGSFITKWEQAIKQKQPIKLTSPFATRFFFTVDDAVDLIFHSLEYCEDSRPLIPSMKGISMGEIVQCLKEIHGDFEVVDIGMQEGENLHETMNGLVYSNEVEQYSREEFKEKFLCPTKL